MVSLNNVTIDFSGKDLFTEISFVINQRDRIGLVGKNGAGKSTLLKIITKEITPTKGWLAIPNNVKIGYLPQQMIYPVGQTVLQEALCAFTEMIEIEKEIAEINKIIAETEDYHSEEYLKYINRLSELNQRQDILGSNNCQAETEQVLKGLGFRQTDFSRQTNEFSGGWRMRIELAKLLLQKPNLFLLDEPTNHLDIESIQWLEDFLSDYPGAVVIISHDRTFLDTVTKRTIEIANGNLYDYDASYSKFVLLREERRQTQLAAYQNQQKYIEETEKFIERFRYKATKAVQVQSRIKQLDKIERIEIDDIETSCIHFKFPPAPRAGDIVIEAIQLSKRYGENLIIEDIDFIMERGEKIAFVGRNGEGKTTFARVILNEIEYTGKLKYGHNLNIGYYAQNQDEHLQLDKTVWQTLDDIAIGEIRTKLRDILGAFLFRDDDIDKKVNVLSGGERARLALAKLLLQPYSLLLLDEPTNHLDMKSKDILKKALKAYDGSLIIVSHDRDFLNELVETVYEFQNKKIRQHKGGIFDFLRRKKIADMQEIERKIEKKQEKIGDDALTENKLKYIEKKEQDKIIRKIKKQIEECELKITNLENDIERTNKIMSEPGIIQDKNIFQKYTAMQNKLKEEMENWEKLNHELENL